MPRSSNLGLLFAPKSIQQALRIASACPELLLRQSAGDAHPGEGSAREGPGKGEQVPRRDGNQVQAGRKGANADEHGAPGLAVIKFEHLRAAWCRDGGA
eukprot:1137980-Pelagomonas_calceolata.AAC.1